MKSVIVTYDLRAPGRDYSSLYDKFKAYPAWAKITESTWLLKTDKSCVDVRNDIDSALDSNDRIFVTESTGVGAWRNVICESDFLKKNL